jgi:hypothetical protein
MAGLYGYANGNLSFSLKQKPNSDTWRLVVEDSVSHRIGKKHPVGSDSDNKYEVFINTRKLCALSELPPCCQYELCFVELLNTKIWKICASGVK